ncbi:MAG TPA: type II secretion system protein GspG [Candidatus Omnitrophica bacterium]|nr:type II secretion system protein GspG [Candidatus Omnitrophota bacterium]
MIVFSIQYSVDSKHPSARRKKKTTTETRLLTAYRNGFTLIEIMIVVIILGLLATLIVPKIMNRPEEARRVQAKIQIRNIESALKLFKLDNGFYPSTEQGLQALVEKPTTGRIPKNYPEGGYLEGGKVPLDPWGYPYIYLCPGLYGDYDIISYGRDGKEGGEGFDADLYSWEMD